MIRYNFVSMMFPIFFITIFIIFIITFIKRIKESSYNKAQPRLTVNAKAVSKRTKVTGGMNKSNMNRGYTYYYVTFQFEGDDRLELKMNGSEFGMIVEGDNGKLTFQGNKFFSFERI